MTARRIAARIAAVIALAASAPIAAPARHVLHVGPHGEFARLADAARTARSGDAIEIEAGEYVDDVATLTQDDLVVRAIGGPARLVARGASAEGKAILVIKGDDVTIEGLQLAGAHVKDRNGAGIRHEGGRLTVRDCLFEDNEMGLVTWNDRRAELVVERSEFRANRVSDRYRPGDAIGHQIYVGTIARFTLRDSYVHDGAFGHLVKSRAQVSLVVNNRLTDETGGRASYELEFPAGGVAYVLGNLIGQSATTANEDIVSYGAEGYAWQDNALYLVNNTLVDALPRNGRVLHVHGTPRTVDVIDNLVFGNRLERPGVPGRFVANFTARRGDAVAPDAGDYRLRRGSPLAGRARDPGEVDGVPLRPAREYAHPRASRAIGTGPYSPGAFEASAR